MDCCPDCGALHANPDAAQAYGATIFVPVTCTAYIQHGAHSKLHAQLEYCPYQENGACYDVFMSYQLRMRHTSAEVPAGCSALHAESAAPPHAAGCLPPQHWCLPLSPHLLCSGQAFDLLRSPLAVSPCRTRSQLQNAQSSCMSCVRASCTHHKETISQTL